MRIVILGLVALCAGGCASPADPNIPREYVLVPVEGRITVDDKPLTGAWITFLQTDERGTTCSSEVDEDGRYELSYRGSPGAASADYKVAISYKLDPEGKPLGLGARMNPTRDNGGLFAKELIPPEKSNLGKTILKATIPPKGGRFDFDLKGPLLPSVPAGEARSAASPG